MRSTERERGVTVVDVMVAAVVAIVVAVLLMGCFRTGHRVAPINECRSRMWQIGLAVYQYEKHFVAMPNAQWNIYRQIGSYLGVPGGVPSDPTITVVFRCPSDEYLPDDEIANGLSYAPLVDSGYVDGDDDGEPDGNLSYCAWTFSRTGFDVNNNGRMDSEDRASTRRNLTQIAPDTALLVEYWAGPNRLNLGDQYHAGYLLKDWSGDPGNSGTTTGRGGTINFSGPSVTSPKAMSSVANVGGYVFLAQFAEEAQRRGRPRPLDECFHDGAVNLFFADGSVQSRRLKDITGKSPKDIPMWTKTAD